MVKYVLIIIILQISRLFSLSQYLYTASGRKCGFLHTFSKSHSLSKNIFRQTEAADSSAAFLFFLQRKSRVEKPPCTGIMQLVFLRCSNGANAFAGSARDTCICIDFVFSVAFSDSAYRALSLTCAAGNTII